MSKKAIRQRDSAPDFFDPAIQSAAPNPEILLYLRDLAPTWQPFSPPETDAKDKALGVLVLARGIQITDGPPPRIRLTVSGERWQKMLVDRAYGDRAEGAVLHCVWLAWKEAESGNTEDAGKTATESQSANDEKAEATLPAIETPVYRRNGKIHKSPRIYAVWMEWKYGHAKCGHRAPTDRTVYEWLRANSRNLATESGTRTIKVRTPNDKDGDSRLVEKEVPFGPRLPIAAEAAQARRLDFETWARYLREARRIEGLERQNSRKKSERRARRR